MVALYVFMNFWLTNCCIKEVLPVLEKKYTEGYNSNNNHNKNGEIIVEQQKVVKVWVVSWKEHRCPKNQKKIVLGRFFWNVRHPLNGGWQCCAICTGSGVDAIDGGAVWRIVFWVDTQLHLFFFLSRYLFGFGGCLFRGGCELNSNVYTRGRQWTYLLSPTIMILSNAFVRWLMVIYFKEWCSVFAKTSNRHGPRYSPILQLKLNSF